VVDRKVRGELGERRRYEVVLEESVAVPKLVSFSLHIYSDSYAKQKHR
jgi:hypothetical protein